MEPLLVELKQNRPGFDGFIGSWICMGDRNMVFDVGPANSVSMLIKTLKAMNVDRVDFVLLTHIHIDHAGGLSDFLKNYPMAQIVCHSMGVKHLVDPSKLWAGSLKVLGKLAELYGPMRPVSEDALIPHTEARINDLQIIETPGHAPHHLSFCYQGKLFVGEASGTYHKIGDQEYVRPAAPPKFFMEECLSSVERLLSIEDLPIFYVHFGRAPSSHEKLNRFRDQLVLWADLIKQEMSSDEPNVVERCMKSLLERDPDLRAFEAMEPEVRGREQYFITNSIHGFMEYLEGQ